MGYGANGCQRLAAKTEGPDGKQVLLGLQLGGSMPLERQRHLGRRDPRSVVGHLDQAATTALDAHADGACPGIEGVLDQLLDDRRGSFNHLTGGDGGGDVFG